jgi:hypothetical protein
MSTEDQEFHDTSTTEEQTTATPTEEKAEEVQQLTQRQLDEIVEKRLSRERKKFAREREEMARSQQQQTYQLEEPNPDQFKDNQSYIEAVVEFRSNLKAEQKLFTKTLQTKKDEAAEKYDDYYEVINRDDLHFTSAMVESVIDSPNFADVTYYLANNPDVALKISKMTPLKQAREMALLEDTVKKELKNETKSEKAKVTSSKAPPPIKPVRGGDSRVIDVDNPDDDVSMDDWVQAWKKKVASRL